MVELLPCPWCNGEATLTSDGDPNWPIRIMDIHNEGCPLGFHQLQICYPDEATAAEAWNTRATPPAPVEQDVERLRRALEPFAQLAQRKANYVIRPNDPIVLEAVRALAK